MPSPFPGMNAYLETEDVWHDFHERCIPAVAEALGPHLFPSYIVRIDETMYVHEIGTEDRYQAGRPNMGVLFRSGEEKPAGVAAVIDAPVRVELAQVDVEGLSYIEILDRASRKLVTVIEILSPSNKRSGPDWDQYLGKRRRWLNSPVNLVEIDMLRAYPPMPDQRRPPCDYSVLISRVGDRPHAELWPIALRSPLPLIPIPLSEGHPDVSLDLKAVLDRVYDAAGYDYYIYDQEPDPPLSEDDMRWAAALITARPASAPFPRTT